MMTSEAFRELAAYLVAISRLADVEIDLAEAYGAGLRQQAALSDQLQAARALLLSRAAQEPERLRLAATIGVMLDVFDDLLASTCDLPRLRKTPDAGKLLARIGLLLRAGALDIQRLSLDLLAHRDAAPAARPFAGIRGDAARGDAHPEPRYAERRGQDGDLGDHAPARPPRAPISGGSSTRSPIPTTRRRTLARYRSRRLSAAPLVRSAPAESPTDARLAGAALCGQAVDGDDDRRASSPLGLGGERHGNWVLLTIAVILRPTYGLTRQRRDHRLIGTLIGCVLSAGAVAYLPVPELVAMQSLSLALVHGFVRLNYWLASIGASMSALISLHLIAPHEAAPVLNRLADTIIGAAICHVFNFVWPAWELSVAPSLAKRLLARAFALRRHCARSQGSGSGLPDGAQGFHRGAWRRCRIRLRAWAASRSRRGAGSRK